ncbi:hypothetical protein TIFTF001_046768, partial [Ficus carica]
MAICDSKMKDVLPFLAIAVVESTTVGLHTLYKAATLKGLKFFVYLTYSYVLGTLLLLPLSFIFFRRGLPSFKLPVLYRLILLSVIGFSSRICGYKGLEYSSPSLSSTIDTLMPAFTFFLAVVFRMEHLDLRSSSTQTKILGTIVSILGALVMVLYKGPTILSRSATTESSQSLHFPLRTSQTNWTKGGLLLVADKLLNSSSLILQAHILKMYPAELIVSFANCLLVAIIAAPVGFMVERDMNNWILKFDIRLSTVIYSAFLGPAFINSIQNLCLPLKGPLYVAIFTPLAIVLAAAASFVFLGEALHLW